MQISIFHPSNPWVGGRYPNDGEKRRKNPPLKHQPHNKIHNQRAIFYVNSEKRTVPWTRTATTLLLLPHLSIYGVSGGDCCGGGVVDAEDGGEDLFEEADDNEEEPFDVNEDTEEENADLAGE